MPRDFRLCLFGDSFVNGTGDQDHLGWSGRVGAAVSRHGHALTSYNLGIRRDTSVDIALRWRAEAERRLPGHVDGRLIFSFGMNDCVLERGVPRVQPQESAANCRNILTTAQAWKPTLFIGPPAPLPHDPVIVSDHLLHCSQAYASICLDLGIPYLDLTSRLIADERWAAAVTAGDGVHPVADGYQQIAEIILAWPAFWAWFDDPEVGQKG